MRPTTGKRHYWLEVAPQEEETPQATHFASLMTHVRYLRRSLGLQLRPRHVQCRAVLHSLGTDRLWQDSHKKGGVAALPSPREASKGTSGCISLYSATNRDLRLIVFFFFLSRFFICEALVKIQCQKSIVSRRISLVDVRERVSAGHL